MKKLVFLFPGQGSQYVGMGKKLCEAYKVASETFDEASEALSQDIKKLCFEGDLEFLTKTENAQPAILTASVATYRVCQELEIAPQYMAGHSLGEISALACAGAIKFADAVKIVRKRGEYMQNAVPLSVGAMAAVSTRDIKKLLALCEDVSKENNIVGISNFNSMTQFVISGHAAAVNQVVELLEAEGIKARMLKVSAPFHSPLMQPAADLMKEELQKYTFSDLQCDVISNITAKPYEGKDVIIDNLVKQIVNPVQWSDSMMYLKKAMVDYGVEVGAGNVLKNLMLSNVSDLKVFSFDNAKDVEKLKEYRKSILIPFLSRSMGIAVATKNNNWDNDEYEAGVIEPYNKIARMQDDIMLAGREASEEEMKQAIEMLKLVFKTKHTPYEEQAARFQELFSDTGTIKLFQDFQVAKVEV